MGLKLGLELGGLLIQLQVPDFFSTQPSPPSLPPPHSGVRGGDSDGDDGLPNPPVQRPAESGGGVGGVRCGIFQPRSSLGCVSVVVTGDGLNPSEIDLERN